MAEWEAHTLRIISIRSSSPMACALASASSPTWMWYLRAVVVHWEKLSALSPGPAMARCQEDGIARREQKKTRETEVALMPFHVI